MRVLLGLLFQAQPFLPQPGSPTRQPASPQAGSQPQDRTNTPGATSRSANRLWICGHLPLTAFLESAHSPSDLLTEHDVDVAPLRGASPWDRRVSLLLSIVFQRRKHAARL